MGSICVNVHTHIHICIHIYIYKHAYVHIHIYTCMHVYIRVFGFFRISTTGRSEGFILGVLDIEKWVFPALKVLQFLGRPSRWLCCGPPDFRTSIGTHRYRYCIYIYVHINTYVF